AGWPWLRRPGAKAARHRIAARRRPPSPRAPTGGGRWSPRGPRRWTRSRAPLVAARRDRSQVVEKWLLPSTPAFALGWPRWAKAAGPRPEPKERDEMKLIIEDDEGRKTVVPLVRDEITIGRQEGNTI